VVVLTQLADGQSVERSRGRARDVEIRHAGQVRAVAVHLEVHLEGLGAPVVPNALGVRCVPQDGLRPLRGRAKRRDVLARDAHGDRSSDRLSVLELSHVDPRAGDLT
jgi:hypothetical protein